MLAVTGLGMISALGADVVTSCAAARAGLQRIVQVDDLLVTDAEGDETAPVAVHRAPYVSAGFFGYARLLQLGTAGLADLLRASGALDAPSLGAVLLTGGEAHRRDWLAAAQRDAELAEGNVLDDVQAAIDAAEQRIQARLLDALLLRAGLGAIPRQARRTVQTTAVGLVGALKQAQAWLEQGLCARVLVGTVDSLLDPTTLEALNHLGLLKTPQRPVGLMPGEAAAFLLLELPRGAAAHGAPTQALLDGFAFEPGAPRAPDAPARDGRELARAMAQALGRAREDAPAVGWTIANLNGDANRASAWGHAVVSTLVPARVSGPTWVPAAAFGDTGAASGGVAVAMVARAAARGYRGNGPNALVCLMDDHGAAAAFRARA